MLPTETAFCAETVRRLFQELGLHTALIYLFSYLKDSLCVERIYCGFRKEHSSSFVPMADTLSQGSKYTTATRPHEVITPERMQYFFGPDVYRPHIVNTTDAVSVPHGLMLRPEDTPSFMRIPLFVHHGNSFQMCFCSSIPGTFVEDRLPLLQQMLAPLGQAVLERFLHNDLPELCGGDALEPQQPASVLLRRCKGLTSLLLLVERVAPTRSTVLITGETGVGKEVVADAIHEFSPRCNQTLIKLNCGALTESLLDSELFGYERGAFTGAIASHPGVFEQAEGGTVFLDEIGELSPGAQVRLLRVLERKEIRRVGSVQPRRVDCRIVAATHCDLQQMVEAGRFRSDLWFRLNVLPIEVPPLRHRREDIAVLARHFMALKAEELGIAVPPLSASQMEDLYRRDWPGNVRELLYTIERMALSAQHGIDVAEPACPVPAPDELTLRGPDNWPTLHEIEAAYIQAVLRKTEGRITGPRGAAEILGIHPNTLRQKRTRQAPDRR